VGIAGCAAVATAAIAVAQEPAAIGVGDPALNPNGSARLPVSVPSAGNIAIRDVRGVPPIRVCAPPTRFKKDTVAASAGGLVELPVIPSHVAAKKIAAGKTVKIVAQITFTPSGGTQSTVVKVMRLHRARGTSLVRGLASVACTTPRPKK
jgi:hypothetical protein